MRGEVELRCFCSKRPLLGVGYRDPRTGEPRLHVKIFKQSRVFGEIVATSGEVHVRCRECERWTRVVIRREPILKRETPDPEVLSSIPG